MGIYRGFTEGFRISDELITRLEGLLFPDAAAEQAEYRAQLEAGVWDDRLDPGMIEFILSEDAPDSTPAQVLSWHTCTVTGSDGIERSMEGGMFDQPLKFPTLEGARSVTLELSALSPLSRSNPRIALNVVGSNCHFTLEAADDVIAELKARTTSALQEFVDPDLLPTPSTFRVFIGHGGDRQWKYLYRTLNETPGMTAEAFESSERAGFHTLVVVDQLVRSSSVAVVVMTGEDRTDGGELRARENVVHEVGFCQGALGIENTIVVLEEGVSEPSNIAGLTQIRFPKGGLIDVESRIVEVLEQRRQVFEYQQS